MALTTYSDLQGVIADELNRTDLASQIIDWITLAEKTIMTELEWFMETYSLAHSGTPLTLMTNPVQLPDYVRDVRSIRCAGTSAYYHPITLVTEADFASRQSSNANAAGIPIIAYVSPQMATWQAPGQTGTGPWLSLWPTPDTSFAIDLTYRRTMISITTGSNQLWALHPALYLYGALIHSAPFLQHDDRLPVWQGLYNDELKKIRIERDRAEWGAVPRRIRLPVVFG